jgi:ATP-dependent Clp protease ATP-binding subunit ClpC
MPPVGTQHLLLGLIREDITDMKGILEGFGLSTSRVLAEVERISPTGPDMVIMGKIPWTPLTRAVVGVAIDEAGGMDQRIITPNHLLLALCRVNPSAATRVLWALDVPLACLCKSVLTVLGRNPLDWLRRRPEVW